MRTLILLLCGLLAATQAPARPDLSGDWVLDPSKTTTTGGPMRVGGAGRAGTPAAPGTVTEPRKVKDVKPVYPREAQNAKVSGMVLLEAVIDRQGKVKDLRILRSVRELDQAAFDAVSKWEYTPTLVAGVPVEIIMTVTVVFSLSGQAPQMGVSVGNPGWPSQPAGAVRPGMGRGIASSEISIKQSESELTLIRRFGETKDEIRYRFDGRPSSNKLPGTGGAVDNTYVYVSRWEGEKLVSTVTWIGPQGPRERTETIWLDGDVLKVQTLRAAADPGAEPMITTNVFERKR